MSNGTEEKKKPMRKGELFAYLADKENLSKRQVREFLDTFIKLAYTQIRKRGAFIIPDLGKFTLQNRKARMGRNPATGEQIKIKAKTVLKFRVAKAAKDACLESAK